MERESSIASQAQFAVTLRSIVWQTRMTSRFLKLICSLVIGLQVLTSIASAHELILCVPVNGAAHIENRNQQQNCSKEPRQQTNSGQATIIDASKPCLDLPLGGISSSAVKPAQKTAQFGAARFIAVLPSFLQITLDPFSSATVRRIEASADAVPEAALDSLDTVILVI